jgi:hypothetical protein
MTNMLLIFEPAEQRQPRTKAESRDLYDRMLKFGEQLKSMIGSSMSTASRIWGSCRRAANG